MVWGVAIQRFVPPALKANNLTVCLSSNNRSITELQNSVETRVNMEASKILHKERALCRQLLEGIPFLQKELELRQTERDNLREKASEISVEWDDLENEFRERDQQRSILKKVRGPHFLASAEEVHNSKPNEIHI